MPTVGERPRTRGSWKLSAVMGMAAVITGPAVAASAVLAPSVVREVAEKTRGTVAKKTMDTSDDDLSVPEMIKAVFGSRASEALRIARCESRYDPSARNGSHLGVFQIHHRRHARRIEKVGGKDLYDPMTNVRVAHSLMKDKGWRPWTCRYAIGADSSGPRVSAGSSKSRRYTKAPVNNFPVMTYGSSSRGAPAARSPRRPSMST